MCGQIDRTASMQGVVGTALLSDGCCAVQDEAAGLVVALLDPQPGDSVADVCAAPGGKALFTAARLRGQVCATIDRVAVATMRAALVTPLKP
jgi:16S rRNA C967 or C1407 C5-methylase (RsmB/RsmF family)